MGDQQEIVSNRVYSPEERETAAAAYFASRESNTPWRELKKSYPQEDMENRRADKDYATEMAIRTDFSKFSLEKSVPLDTVIRRAQYRPEYDFKALPHGQRFLMYTTYGPDKDKYDIFFETPEGKTGLQIYGIFDTLDSAMKKLAIIRLCIPLAVFQNIHIHDLQSGRLEIPPSCDGNAETQYINSNYQEVIGPYLKKRVVDEAHAVQERTTKAQKMVSQLQSFIKQNEGAIDLASKEIAVFSSMTETNKQEETIEEQMNNYPTFHPPTDDKIDYKTPGLKTVEQLAKETTRTVPPSLLDFHLNQISLANGDLPPNQLCVFSKYKAPGSDKWVVFRCIYRKIQ